MSDCLTKALRFDKRNPVHYTWAMGPIWIIGAGRFGMRAADRLIGPGLAVEHRIVDTDAQACRTARQSGYNAVCQDGIEFLHQHLHHAHDADWIVPAIPHHVAFQWIQRRLSECCTIENCDLPDGLIGHLPNPVRTARSTVYTSIARFVCPEDCPEPPDMCWTTRKPRPCRVDEVLASYRSERWCTAVVRSHSLAPGVGGYRSERLLQALAAVESASLPVILATACRCHGVVDAFKTTPRSLVDIS